MIINSLIAPVLLRERNPLAVIAVQNAVKWTIVETESCQKNESDLER